MVKVKAKLEECTERVNISRRTFRLRMRSGKAELEGSWEILKIPVQKDDEIKLQGHQLCANNSLRLSALKKDAVEKKERCTTRSWRKTVRQRMRRSRWRRNA